jgi:cell division protein FtsQ
MPRINNGGGTRRAHLQRMSQRKKPTPLWLQRLYRLGGVGLLVTAFLGIPYALYATGWLPEKYDQTKQSWLTHTAGTGLAVSDIYVVGRNETTGPDVLAAIDVQKGQPLLAFDPATAKERVEKLPWVRQARIERRFPGTVMVSLTERAPIGFLQKEGRLSLVDESGTVLATEGLARWAGLPILIGEGAPQHTPALLEILSNHPDLRPRIKAFTYIGQRRWDLHLINNIIINLPETDPAAALERLESAQADSRVLEKDIRAIDLRLPDRMIITPTPAAQARAQQPKEGI